LNKSSDNNSSPIKLAGFPRFALFETDELIILEGACRKFNLPNNAVIYAPRQSSPYLFLISCGTVKISRDTPYGEVAFALLRAGDICGEEYFINHSLPSNKAIITSGVSLYSWETERLTSLFKAEKVLAAKFYWTIWQSLTNRLRIANDWLWQFFQEQISLSKGSGAREVVERAFAKEVKVDVDVKIDAFKLKGLSPKEMDLLTQWGKEHWYQEDSVIFNEGDKGDSLYIILDGSVRISKQVPGIGEEALAILQKGDYFGEMALIDQERRSATARAHDGSVTLLAISRKDMQEIISSYVDLAVKFLWIICRILSDRLENMQDKICQWKIMAGRF